MKRFTVPVMLLVFAFQFAHADTTHEARLPPLAAEYAMSTGVGKRSVAPASWYFIRDTHRVEIIRPQEKLAEMWDRSEHGELTLQRIFHADRRIVEYVPGEFKVSGIQNSWASLSSMIDPGLIKQLQPTGAKEMLGRRVSLYETTVGEQRLRFGWFDDLSLLAFLEREDHSGRSSLNITALYTVAPDNWHEFSEQQLRDYLVIDASDFGDMEYDPFVRKVMALDAQNPVFGFKRSEPAHQHH